MSEYKFIKTHKALYQFIKTKVNTFDVTGSLRLTARFSFVCDGKLHHTRNFNMMLQELNLITGKETFDVKKSAAKGKFSYMLYLGSGDIVSSEEPTVDVVPVVEVEPAVENSDVPEDVVVVEEAVSENTLDLEYIESIPDTKDGKTSLFEYAEKFGVKLNKRNTLENMIAALKEAV